MNSSAPASSEQIVVQCPACGAAEAVEAETLAGQPDIVCRECGDTWPAGEAEAKRRTNTQGKSDKGGEILVAEKRALVTYSDAADDAWAAKIAGDYWPEPPRHSRIPMLAAAMAAMFFLAAFFGAREGAVAALPDLAGLYAAMRLPVNLDRFAIEDVKAERTPTFGGSRLAVHATLRNVGGTEMPIPPLATVLYSNALVPAGAYGFDPPAAAVGPGESVSLVMQLDTAPEQAAEVVVRFRRRGETLAVAGAAEPISQ